MNKKKYQKVIYWKPNIKFIAVSSLFFLILLMIPLIRIAMYTVPYYDDYNFGLFAKIFIGEGNKIIGALKGALYCTRTQWYCWQGTYSASFLNTLMPEIWGEGMYFIGPLFLIFILPFSIFVFVWTLSSKLLKSDLFSCLSLQCILAAMVVVLLYSPQQGFYWYVGGISYVGMHSFFILLVSIWVNLLFEHNKIKKIIFLLLSVFGAFILGGANFISGLQGIIVCFGLIVLGFCYRKKETFRLIPSCLVYMIGFIINVTAPGNSVRAGNYVGWGYSPMEAILRSFFEAFRFVGTFLGWITPLIMIVLIPVILKLIDNTDYSFRFPGIVSLISFCLYATGFTPSLYAMGTTGYGRTLNVVKITFQLLLIINEVYWIGWIKKIIKSERKPVFYWWFYVIAIIGMVLVFFFLTPSQGGMYSSYGAYYFVHTGEAYNYYHEYLDRVETIKNSGDDVIVKPYYFKPWFLCISDLNANPYSEENQSMARWFGKNTITCIAEETE